MDAITLCSATLSDNGQVEPPLGPLYVASALEQEGLRVEFRDYQLSPEGNSFDSAPLVRFLDGHQQVVLISCFVDMLPLVLDAARQLKSQRPDATIVLGGPGPTARARDFLLRFPWIDGIVQGEGEETIREWVRTLQGEKRPVAGMVQRVGTDILDAPERPRIEHIDLTLPAYHLLDWHQYQGARIITTRGCPYHCTFCDVSALWRHRTIYRDLDATIAEMELLCERYGKRGVGIVDDTFVLKVQRVREFCHRLINAGTRFKWGCFARINLMTPALIELMARAGCEAVFYGIDSGSQSVLRQTHKALDASMVIPVLRQSARYFDQIEASFIWGYPYESLADFQETIDLAGAASMLAPQVNVQLHLLSPLPNSQVFQQYGHKLLRPDPEDKLWLILPPLLLDDRGSELRPMLEGSPELFPGFYTLPTPEKAAKQRVLEQVTRALTRTVGRTFFETEVDQLLDSEASDVERAMVAEHQSARDRIGVGLAIGFFRRARRARRAHNVSMGLDPAATAGSCKDGN